MLALWGESPLSVTELGRLLHLDSPTLSPLLKRLEASGYVTRSRSVTDERVLEIELTRRGRALRAKAEKVPEIIVAKLGIEIADLEALQVALTRVIVAADAV
jgi:DNA-binding MarR family transcriptional regulator